MQQDDGDAQEGPRAADFAGLEARWEKEEGRLSAKVSRPSSCTGRSLLKSTEPCQAPVIVPALASKTSSKVPVPWRVA
jgi:hypothetical protein